MRAIDMCAALWSSWQLQSIWTRRQRHTPMSIIGWETTFASGGRRPCSRKWTLLGSQGSGSSPGCHREENRQREAKNLPSLELGVRSFAQRAFGTAKRASRNFKFTVQRGDSWSDFMQFMWLATQSGWSPAPWVMDWDDPGFDGKSPEFHVVFKVQGKEQPGMDAGGLRRELLQGVLLSALAPKDVENDGTSASGMACAAWTSRTRRIICSSSCRLATLSCPSERSMPAHQQRLRSCILSLVSF